MTQVEKLILEKLDGINDRLDRLEVRMDKLEARMDNLEIQLNERMDKLEARMDKVDTQLNEKITKLHVLVESDISKKIDVIGEGHDFLDRKLDQALMLAGRWEKTTLEQINLKMAVDRMRDNLNIA
ncbi:MAG: hypothetical protein Q4F28_01910 [Eubacteriales bacterium]|nr:hypothetical protein [Eubacteriales bacterium]